MQFKNLGSNLKGHGENLYIQIATVQHENILAFQKKMEPSVQPLGHLFMDQNFKKEK